MRHKPCRKTLASPMARQARGSLPSLSLLLLLLLLPLALPPSLAAAHSHGHRRPRTRLAKRWRHQLRRPSSKSSSSSSSSSSADAAAGNSTVDASTVDFLDYNRPTPWDIPASTAFTADPDALDLVKGQVQVQAQAQVQGKGKSKGKGTTSELALPRASWPAKCPKLKIVNLGKGTIDPEHTYMLCSIPDRWKGTLRMTVSNTAIGARWKGWGTSLSEIGGFIGRSDPVRMECLGTLLFNKAFMGLNMARYQIPGGYNKKYSPKMAKNKFYGTGYWPKRNSKVFNATSDAFQVRALRLAARSGAKYLDAVSYSPPWWMTRTNATEGGFREGETNLKPRFGPLYAEYLATVVRYLESTYRLNFYSLSPFNEPMEGWWTQKPKKQTVHEGCNFTPGEINQQAGFFRKQFPFRRIGGVDSWMRTMSDQGLPKPWDPPTAPGLDWWRFNQFNVHGYRLKSNLNPVDDYCSMCGLSGQVRRVSAVARRQIPVWQSEWGPLGISRASDLDLALFMARRINQHVNLLGAEAWFHWQAYARINAFWGIARMNFTKSFKRIVLTKSYFVFKHYSLFMVEGSVPLALTQFCEHTVVAFYTPQTASVTMTFVNQRSGNRRILINLSGFSCPRRRAKGRPCTVRAVITDKRNNLIPYGAPGLMLYQRQGLLARVVVPEYSILTVVASGVSGAPVFPASGANPMCSVNTMKRRRCRLVPR